MDKYGRREASEVAAATASRVFMQVNLTELIILLMDQLIASGSSMTTIPHMSHTTSMITSRTKVEAPDAAVPPFMNLKGAWLVVMHPPRLP